MSRNLDALDWIAVAASGAALGIFIGAMFGDSARTGLQNLYPEKTRFVSRGGGFPSQNSFQLNFNRVPAICGPCRPAIAPRTLEDFAQ